MSEVIKQSYVGVSGVVSPEMEASLESIANEVGLTNKGRAILLGVKATHKTQYLDTENKYGQEWYPVGESAFSHALRHGNRTTNTIAVAQAYFDLASVGSAEYRDRFLARIAERGQPWLQGIQFDMLPWHTNDDMWDFLEQVKQRNLAVLLQAHKPAMEALGPKGVITMIGRHAHLVDYVLFDSSHGTGTRLDTAALEPFVAESYSRLDMSQTGIAIAGGLNGQNVREDLPPLIAKYPYLSWDAEGQLHPIDSVGKRPLDIPTTQDYLQSSADILHK